MVVFVLVLFGFGRKVVSGLKFRLILLFGRCVNVLCFVAILNRRASNGNQSISLARKRLLYMSIITNVMVCWSFWEESKSERECQFLEMLFIALCS